jgi:cytochrome c oxidase cbb3-type subunit III
MKKLIILPLLLVNFSINASIIGYVNTEPTVYEAILIGAMAIMTLVLLVIAFTLQGFVKSLLPKEEKNMVLEKALEDRTFLQKVFSLKPLSMEKDMIMEHTYDGIAELDNPTPPWFMYLFYSTIVIAVVYLFTFHVVGNGKIMTTEYAEEIAVAEKANELYMKKFANAVNENNVIVLTDAKSIEDGGKIYAKNCVACHGDKGQGGVGPNLTDEFWLHGGSTKNIFHTLTEGVPEKGMISWKKTLNPIQIQHLVSFLSRFQGTNPENGKAPQGDKYVATALEKPVAK